jgi:ATP-dependent DNA ligase
MTGHGERKQHLAPQSRAFAQFRYPTPPADLCQALAGHLPPGLVLDGEVIIWDGQSGRTSFARLQRRFTAGRRLADEAAQHSAHFVAFDVLQDAAGRELLDQPLDKRRRRLQRLLGSAPPQLALCPQTSDESTAHTWRTDWSASGIEGLL